MCPFSDGVTCGVMGAAACVRAVDHAASLTAAAGAACCLGCLNAGFGSGVCFVIHVYIHVLLLRVG